MAIYNFDEIIDRSGTNALKLDALEERYGQKDLIPLWVADMDFKSPPAITEAIIKRAQHGIYGYTRPSEKYFESIIGWNKNKHNWRIKQEWISFIPGIVKGIAFVIDCFTEKGDKILIQPPVYHPFRIIPELHHRQIINNLLILDTAGYYKMNIADLKNKIQDCKVLILCNPHNPGGRVWTRDELAEIADICFENNVLVISDEIHSDLAFEEKGHKHIPFASVSEKAAQNSITFMAPSKTFNIAGIVSSFTIVPNDKIRKQFFDYLTASELEEGHIFAYLAAEVAYSSCDEWLKELIQYLSDNIEFVDEYLKNNIPRIKALIPQASYLIWLDCRELGLKQNELASLFTNDAHLALNDGAMFGPGGEGFMRLNIGSPRSVLKQALENLKNAIKKTNK